MEKAALSQTWHREEVKRKVLDFPPTSLSSAG
jgi:hypothetical protein